MYSKLNVRYSFYWKYTQNLKESLLFPSKNQKMLEKRQKVLKYQTDIENYESGKPDFPIGLTDWLVDEFGVNEESTILDLGAGTGKLYPRINAAHPQKVMAVDSSEAMLKVLQKKYPAVESHLGSATQIPLPDESVDLILCGNSFHWFANAKALKEMHRVLKPKGALGLVWNVRDKSVSWVNKINELLDKYRSGSPYFGTWEWAQLFPGHGFQKFRTCVFPFSYCTTPENSIHRMVFSLSYMHALPEQEKAVVRAELDKIAETVPRVQNTDQIKFPYHTMAFSIEKEALEKK
ncbi:methyltransferase [Schizosaccharomyces octosporus yFS286]|uniref:Methyltransferase n=1 Tax=Schizosaccharomyces octosporus (strain yFS286) TaxID=483514 RepID=S9Q0P6_SCHOY|nr:methyltransferase [Schizosaccharomyces octosporus yFS286]EPX73767.1 methyltransferase [Schizosaccharomyces octosporus yFS286]